MRIVFLMTAGMNRPPGVRYFNIARELARQGHTVRILALHPDLENCHARRFREDGVEIWYVGQMHVRKQGGHEENFDTLTLLRVILLSTLGLVWGILRSPAQIYHLCKAQPINGLAALIGVRLLRRQPFYVDCDDDETHSNRLSPLQRRVFAFWEWLLVRLAAGTTVNTRFLAERNRRFGAKRIVYVPNGVDPACFRPQPQLTAGLRTALGLDGHPVIAYFGSINFKNHPLPLLMDAFALVHCARPDARLMIIGGGADLAQLQAQAQQLGVAAAVLFLGRLPHSALPVFLGMAHMSTDPIYNDSVAKARSPLKLYESMGLGVPVVTADVGDRAEWLDNGDAGVLVEAGSPQALAHGMRALLDDPARQAQLAANARLRAHEHYTWSRLAHDWLAVYTSPTPETVRGRR